MRRIFIILWLIITCIAGGYLLLRIHDGLTFSTDLMALLPHEEQDQVLQRADDIVTKSLSQRILLFVGHKNREEARSASMKIKHSLANSGLVELTADGFDKDRLKTIGKLYFPYRFGLLSEEYRYKLQEGKGQEIATRALSQVYGLVGMAGGKLLQNDPFLLLPNFFTSLPLPFSRLELDDGMLSLNDDGKTWVLITGQLRGDAFALDTQKQLEEVYEQATKTQIAEHSGLEILHLGAVFYAKDGAEKAMQETSLISIISTLGIILLVLVVFRAASPLWLTLLVIGVGVMVALSASLWVFGELHIGALLFGVSLIGVSVDYSLQYFSELFSPNSGLSYARLLRVRSAISIGAATTIIGYLTLFLAPFPGLHQVAVFSVIGLIAAWLTVILWLPALDKSTIPNHGGRLLAIAEKIMNFWQNSCYHRIRIYILGLALLLVVAGYLRFHTDDDVRRMQSLSPALVEEQELIQKRIGSTQSNQFFLIQAPTNELALQHEEELAEKLVLQVKNGALSGFQSPASYISSARRQMENRELVRKQLYPLLAKQITALQLKNAPQLLDGNAPVLTLSAINNAQSPLSFLSLMLLSGEEKGEVVHVVMLEGVKDIPALANLAKNMEGVRFVDPVGDFSNLLGKYRSRALALIVLSALFMTPLLFWRYGVKGGFLVMLPSLLAVILTPALTALMGEAFTFFDAFGLVLVLSIGVDYAVFFAETTPERKNVTILAVALAAITTMLSFGLLALSQMLAVRHFGLTLLIGIALAFLFAPIARSAAREKQ